MIRSICISVFDGSLALSIRINIFGSSIAGKISLDVGDLLESLIEGFEFGKRIQCLGKDEVVIIETSPNDDVCGSGLRWSDAKTVTLLWIRRTNLHPKASQRMRDILGMFHCDRCGYRCPIKSQNELIASYVVGISSIGVIDGSVEQSKVLFSVNDHVDAWGFSVGGSVCSSFPSNVSDNSHRLIQDEIVPFHTRKLTECLLRFFCRPTWYDISIWSSLSVQFPPSRNRTGQFEHQSTRFSSSSNG